MRDKVEIVMWPNYVWETRDDLDWERDYSWMSDDYKTLFLTEQEYDRLCGGRMTNSEIDAMLASP